MKTDEKVQDMEIYSRQNMHYGDLIVVPFKRFGKTKLELLINNSIVKEASYE
jgi:hypothetical protein